MKPDWTSDNGDIQLYCGDCLRVLPELEAGSVDCILTDPPYGLSFMGKAWDHGIPGVPFWVEALRVAKPGAPLLAFGGTRTQHRLVCAIEDAGWEVRDCLAWMYGSGFPKSLDIGKAIDKAAGAERERIRGVRSGVVGATYAQDEWSQQYKDSVLSFVPITPAAKQWDGWGTALKPAHEPICLAMKPLDGTFAENAQRHGVAGLWIDGGRIGTSKDVPASPSRHSGPVYGVYGPKSGDESGHNPNIGRWPSNVLLSHSAECVEGQCVPDCPVRMLDEQSGGVAGRVGMTEHGSGTNQIYGDYARSGQSFVSDGVADTGTASRFFYTAKAPKSERFCHLSCDCKPIVIPAEHVEARRTRCKNLGKPYACETCGKTYNVESHPTQKPLEIMRYLCRLTRTPTGGTVCDPFMGTATTAVAALQEGRKFIGIENDKGYFDISVRRIQTAIDDWGLFKEKR